MPQLVSRTMTSTSTSAGTAPATTGQVQDPNFGLDEGTLEQLHSRDDQLICKACGTQYDKSGLANCLICDDPRQYVPPTGQEWTTMRSLASTHHNVMVPHASDPNPTNPTLLAIQTEPKFAIGQRAFIIRTPAGNIMWDCLTFLDAPTVSTIQKMGGLAGIVISHPHFYATHLLWASVFNCPVYLASDEKEFLSQPDGEMVRQPSMQEADPDMPTLPGALPEMELGPARVFIEGPVGVSMPINGMDGRPTGVTAYKVGGHFPGSLVLSWNNQLFTADTLMPTPAGVGQKRKGMNSFVFMWSYPNMIPLPPKILESMWAVLSRIPFTSCHAAFPNLDIAGPDTKQNVWESMLIQVQASGGDAKEFQARIERMAHGQPAEGQGEELVQRGRAKIEEGNAMVTKGQEQVRQKIELQTREEREELEQRKQQQAEENMFGQGQGGQVVYTDTRGSQGTGQPMNIDLLPMDGMAIESKQVIVGVQEDEQMVGVVKGGDAALIG